ncbi:MAG: SpoIVB peptidase S55 domain protein [Selenomonadaceae bacterium]|nr:SpoIVB peptidase S55 domain protein [Selenomonadaceae bacterium]
MRGLLKGLALSIAMTMTVLLPTRTEAMPEIMPLDQIENGMSGKAYTVVDNSGVIEPFDVDIIGLIDNGKGSTKMIMAKASGDVINKTGGVLQGMSGSPIYVDGKLVGALAAGLKEMSPYTFFITPIESMLPMWDMPDPKAANKYLQQPIKTPTEEPSTDETKEEPKEEPTPEAPAEEKTDLKDKKDKKERKDKKRKKKKADDQKADDQKVDDQKVEPPTEQPTPSVDEPIVDEAELEPKAEIFFSGFDANGANFLEREFKPLGMRNFYAAAISSDGRSIDYDATLEPGAPIGVAVVYGDFSVGATGTVTAVDGKKILGFGHSFTHAGNVNFFMTDASIIGTVSGVDGSGIKVSSIGNIIGRINQDRESGIAGIIGKFPSVVPITVNITDKNLNKSESYTATIAYNEMLIPKLGASIAYTALSKTADSLAESTVTVDFGIKTNAITSGKIERQNMFYNVTDVGQVAVIELMQALSLVCSNTNVESDIFSIDVNMTLDNERKTASLISATPDRVKVKPGETVNLTVQLQPYRQKSETIVVPYTVPIAMKPGPLTLDIHGGALVPLAQVLANAGLLSDVNEPARDYSERIESFLKTGKNNELVVEPGGVVEPQTEKELKREIERARKAQEKAAKQGKKLEKTPNESKVDTGYIIDNVVHTIIDIEKI